MYKILEIGKLRWSLGSMRVDMRITARYGGLLARHREFERSARGRDASLIGQLTRLVRMMRNLLSKATMLSIWPKKQLSGGYVPVRLMYGKSGTTCPSSTDHTYLWQIPSLPSVHLDERLGTKCTCWGEVRYKVYLERTGSVPCVPVENNFVSKCSCWGYDRYQIYV